jgi:hypothetical protein
LFALMNTQPLTKGMSPATDFRSHKKTSECKKICTSQQTTTALVRFAMIDRTTTSHNFIYWHDYKA